MSMNTGEKRLPRFARSLRFDVEKGFQSKPPTLLESLLMADTPSPVATPLATETPSTGTGDDFEARVVVYNCDCHTYQQVIALFCQCIPGMTPSKAFELAWKIDHQGEAVVFTGGSKQAEEIAGKLAGGGLRVTVQ